MRTLIIDDEKKARDGIKILLGDDSRTEMVGEAKDGKEAIEKIEELKPDLIFLDIQMPGINGFDVLGSIPEKDWPIVIFSTAYDHYALKAFEVQALDYLLKPYSKQRFQKALDFAHESFRTAKSTALEGKLKDLLTNYQKDQKDNELIHSVDDVNSRVIVKTNGRIHFLDVNDIYWIEGLDSYVKIHLLDKTHIVKSTLKSIESKYETFVRIHKSHLVNMKRVQFIEPYFNGDFFLTLRNDVKVRGSRNFKNNLPETF